MQMAKAIGKGKYKGLKAKAFISWMALKRNFSISNTKAKAKYKGKGKGKGKCIGKWFLCHKCGIYLLNTALKRNLSISEGKYKGKM